MSYPKFALYNVIGGLLWVCGLTALGFLVGNHPWVKTHFSLVALAMIIIPSLPAAWVLIKHMMRSRF
jgi:membrane-associated protein